MSAPPTSQTARIAPMGAMIVRPVWIVQTSAPVASASASTPQSGCIAFVSDARFHGRMEPRAG
jgi:hypothetical protein